VVKTRPISQGGKGKRGKGKCGIGKGKHSGIGKPVGAQPTPVGTELVDEDLEEEADWTAEDLDVIDEDLDEDHTEIEEADWTEKDRTAADDADEDDNPPPRKLARSAVSCNLAST
jgi:hypothetical protein